MLFRSCYFHKRVSGALPLQAQTTGPKQSRTRDPRPPHKTDNEHQRGFTPVYPIIMSAQVNDRLFFSIDNTVADRSGRPAVTPAFVPGTTANKRPQRRPTSRSPTSEFGTQCAPKEQMATSTMRHYHLAYQHSMAALSALSSKPSRRTQVADDADAANALVDMKTNALVKNPLTDVGEVVTKACSMMDENYIENIYIGFSHPDNIIMETDTTHETGIFGAFDANEAMRWSPESPPPQGRTPTQSPARPPTRLAVPQDAGHLNSLHQFVRQDLLEIFVAPPNDDEDCAYYGGRVGLRCVHCSTIRRNKAARSAFFPNRLRAIYRDVSSWQQVSHRRGDRTRWLFTPNSRPRPFISPSRITEALQDMPVCAAIGQKRI